MRKFEDFNLEICTKIVLCLCSKIPPAKMYVNCKKKNKTFSCNFLQILKTTYLNLMYLYLYVCTSDVHHMYLN